MPVQTSSGLELKPQDTTKYTSHIQSFLSSQTFTYVRQLQHTC